MARTRVVALLVVTMLLLYTLLGAGVLNVSAAEPYYHTVKWGESLSGIARMYGVTVKAIMEANSLKNANLIYVNQKLAIPGVSGEVVTHVVAQGETLLTIAAKHGVKYWEIAWRNGIVNPNLVVPGQKLVIPKVKPSAPAPSASPATKPVTTTVPVASPAPIKAQQAPIMITNPAANTSIKSPLTITGFGSAFENVLAIDILDQVGKAIGQGQAYIKAEFGQYGPFTGTVTFTMPSNIQPGRVQVYSISPRDGAIEYLASVSVNLKP